MHESTFNAVEKAAQSGAFGVNPTAEPSEAQAAAGNYRKGHVRMHGLDVAIEQPRGTYRTGTDTKTGKRWVSRLAAHYGYFKGTRGADGDPVDCFIGPVPTSDAVFIINQVLSGRFDEAKVMLGFLDEEGARQAYLHSYDRGWPGLGSIVPASPKQLKTWLKTGDMKRPVKASDLPPEGLETMNQRNVAWNKDAQPYDVSLDSVLYDLRRADGGDGLLFDSLTVADILEAANDVLTLDAMVAPFARLPRKMEVLQNVMERVGAQVKPVALQVTDPFKQRGVANVAAIFELSDGQTVTIYFHNPDVTPGRMAPTDELISWKWLLNKKDITIVVAPERGEDLNVREVARRIMRLAEKNSAAFQRANAKRAERMGAIQALKSEVAELETELASAQRELEVAKAEADERQAVKDRAYADAVRSSNAAQDAFVRAQAAGQPTDALRAEAEDSIEQVKAIQAWLTGGAGPSAFAVGDRVMFVRGPYRGIVAEVGGITGDDYVIEMPATATKPAFDLSVRAPHAVAWGMQVAPDVVLTGKELGDFPDTPEGKKALRAAARAYLNALKGRWVECPALPAADDGSVNKVEIRPRGIKHFIHNGANAAKVAMAAAIENIIKTARNARFEDNTKPDEKLSTVGMWRLDSRVSVAGETHDIDVLVERDTMGLFHYDFIINAEKAKAALDSSTAPAVVSAMAPNHKSGIADEGDTATLDAAGQGSGGMVINLFIEGEPPEYVDESGAGADFDPANNPEDYAAIMADEALKLDWQDVLDHLFGKRLIEVRNALRELGWEGANYGTLSKNGVALEQNFEQVGAGKNIVGVHYTLAGVTGFYMSDSLVHTPQELAYRIDMGLPKKAAAPDLTYRELDGGMFTAFYPETEAGKGAWAEIAAKTEGTGKVLSVEVESTIAQLREAGYTVMPRDDDASGASDESLLAELGSAYRLPDGDIDNDWRAVERGTAEPDARQALLMASVQRALDAGKFYSNDVYAFVIADLAIPESLTRINTTNTERGNVGYDIYCARNAIKNKASREETAAATASLALKPGDKLGVLIINANYKMQQFNACVVESVNGHEVTLTAKSGSASYKIKTSALAIIAAMDRAQERGKRKTGSVDFIATRAQAVEGDAPIASSKVAEVDAAYTFADATDEFKEWVHESLTKDDYSPFLTAKRMDEAAKRHGASIQWGFYGGKALDGAFRSQPVLSGAMTLDGVEHAVASLEIALGVAEANEPIYRAAGNIEQADLEAETAASIREAISKLTGDVYESTDEPGDAEVVALDSAGMPYSWMGFNLVNKAYVEAQGATALPSEHALSAGVIVSLGYGDEAALKVAGHVVAATFTATKVRYSVAVPIAPQPKQGVTLYAVIPDVDSELVKPRLPAGHGVAMLDSATAMLLLDVAGKGSLIPTYMRGHKGAVYYRTADSRKDRRFVPVFDAKGNPIKDSDGDDFIAHEDNFYPTQKAADAAAARVSANFAKLAAGKLDAATLDDGTLESGGSEYVGKIIKGGEVVGRVDIGDDGKAMIYVGESGGERVKTESGNDFHYSEDDAEFMVDALFRAGTADAPAAANPDTEFLQAVIAGTVPDMLAPELADQLEAAYLRNPDDPAFGELFERAVAAYEQAMVAATSNTG